MPHSVKAEVGGVFHLGALFSFFSEVLQTSIPLAPTNHTKCLQEWLVDSPPEQLANSAHSQQLQSLEMHQSLLGNLPFLKVSPLPTMLPSATSPTTSPELSPNSMLSSLTYLRLLLMKSSNNLRSSKLRRTRMTLL